MKTLTNKTLRAIATAAAGLLVLLAVAGPLAIASPASAANPSAQDEYQLKLPGGGSKSPQSSDDGGSSALVPIAIGAGVLTIVAVLLLTRYRRQQP